ncbi:hypothetical protein V8C34DRAFT_306940 [Trichoderma compactum]
MDPDPTPVTRTLTLAFTQHSLPQLDTTTPKRPRGDEPQPLDLPTPTSAPRQSTSLLTLPVVDYSLPAHAKANYEACESDETFEDSDKEPESDGEFDDFEGRLFKERKGRRSWAFNAVTNESPIASLYGLRLDH